MCLKMKSNEWTWYEEEEEESASVEEAPPSLQRADFPLIKVGLVLFFASFLGGVSKASIAFVAQNFKRG